jgi:hypothetical protein
MDDGARTPSSLKTSSPPSKQCAPICFTAHAGGSDPGGTSAAHRLINDAVHGVLADNLRHGPIPFGYATVATRILRGSASTGSATASTNVVFVYGGWSALTIMPITPAPVSI